MVVPRIPYTLPFPPPAIHPPGATTLRGAVAAVADFLRSRNTVLLTGAGISVESGLADYRGEKGTYRLNRRYRPIFFAEFAGSHEARKRYWARSFLGWPTMANARPNRTHAAISRLGSLGLVSHVITQNVDSLHHTSHPHLPTTELHGTLRTLTCLTCHTPFPRSTFQRTLSALNPTWHTFLQTATEAGVYDSPPPSSSSSSPLRRARTNPDGDVDLPGAPYSSFRYPPCPSCLAQRRGDVRVDADGAHLPAPGPDDGGGSKTVAVLKPSVTFFGEAVAEGAKVEAEEAVRGADNLLVLGSSLATYSAWRIVKAAHEGGKGVGVVNLGGVRGEEEVFCVGGGSGGSGGGRRVRVEMNAGDVLAGVLREMCGGEEVGGGG